MPDGTESFMRDSDWLKLKYLKKEMAWGDSTKVQLELVLLLESICTYIGKAARINCAYAEDGHATNSQHYLGNAADLVLPGFSLVDQMIIALKFDGVHGLGLYPFWNTPGLHIDIRGLANKYSPDAQWIRSDKGVYEALNWTNIQKYCKK